MASIDKIYGTYADYCEFYVWCVNNYKKALKYFYEWDNEWLWDEKEHPITSFPEDIDYYMLDHCPINFVVNRIKEQYNLK